MTRIWAMPAADTFDCRPIGDFVRLHLLTSRVSVDPFARNRRWATFTNDLNPQTAAEYHMDAVAFLNLLDERGVRADLLIFDPPYSPRQITECYAAAGIKAGMRDTQNSRLYKAARDAAMPLLTSDATVLSFGWNTAGMGLGRGFSITSGMIVCHGAAHNDTLCISERRMTSQDRIDDKRADYQMMYDAYCEVARSHNEEPATFATWMQWELALAAERGDAESVTEGTRQRAMTSTGSGLDGGDAGEMT